MLDASSDKGLLAQSGGSLLTKQPLLLHLPPMSSRTGNISHKATRVWRRRLWHVLWSEHAVSHGQTLPLPRCLPACALIGPCQGGPALSSRGAASDQPGEGQSLHVTAWTLKTFLAPSWRSQHSPWPSDSHRDLNNIRLSTRQPGFKKPGKRQKLNLTDFGTRLNFHPSVARFPIFVARGNRNK